MDLRPSRIRKPRWSHRDKVRRTQHLRFGELLKCNICQRTKRYPQDNFMSCIRCKFYAHPSCFKGANQVNWNNSRDMCLTCRVRCGQCHLELKVNDTIRICRECNDVVHFGCASVKESDTNGNLEPFWCSNCLHKHENQRNVSEIVSTLISSLKVKSDLTKGYDEESNNPTVVPDSSPSNLGSTTSKAPELVVIDELVEPVSTEVEAPTSKIESENVETVTNIELPVEPVLGTELGAEQSEKGSNEPLNFPVASTREQMTRESSNKRCCQTDVKEWSSVDVADYLNELGFSEEAATFKTQEIDGSSLLLLKRQDILNSLHIKIGPALKIFSHIENLKVSGDENTSMPNKKPKLDLPETTPL